MSTAPIHSPRSRRALRALRASRLLATIVATIAVVACADDGPDSTSDGGLHDEPAVTVTIESSRFDAADIEIAVGDTVEFLNLDAFDHTVTSVEDAPDAFDSGIVGQNEVFEVAFEQPGEYRYFCEIHPTMRGVIVVS